MSDDLQADIRQAQVRAGEQAVLDHLAETGLVNPTPEAAIRLPVAVHEDIPNIVVDKLGWTVARFPNERKGPAQAAATVTAINALNGQPAHDKLVTALEKISAQAVCAGMDGDEGNFAMLVNIMEIADAALAAAKEPT